ncbi:hypothetical protein DL546_009365 [Coniochaeta pulveracea]|uniref:Glycine zipper 2TM domain-containing protein n=1 Tax=Coniochaeta pulveracea TaxID=177199 RepID=A0A420YHX5_9PEZI|nr:hypothetical protein DL546_009365 [Coniochaeta pulveracea]
MSSYSARGDDDDDFVHVRSPSHAGRRGRDYSPDYHSGGYMAGGNPSVASPFEEHTPFYAPATRNLNPNPNNSLQVPSSASRPRSTPPYSRSQGRDRRDRDRDDDYREKPSRSRGRDKYRSRQNSDDESDRSRPRSPLGKAKHIAKSTFSDSTSGLGVGVLGAIIGGMAAREASEAAARRGPGSRHGSKDHQGAELLSTIVGAAVGGLGANALEKRLEKSRGKTKEDQEKWERKYGKDERDRDRRDGRSGGGEKERVRDRDRERGWERSERDAEEGRGGRFDNDDSDPEYVYDRRPRRRKSEDQVRYRS